MTALLKKTRKNHVKMTFKELLIHAEGFNPSKYLYVNAPYSMGRDEFLSYYSKYFIILPSLPTWEDLTAGIKNVTGQTMIKFFV